MSDSATAWTAVCQASLHLLVVQSLSRVQLFATPRTAAHQASLSITNSQSLLKLMPIVSVMSSNHFILCCPLLLPSIFPSIRVFSSDSVLCIRWPNYWNFRISPSIMIFINYFLSNVFLSLNNRLSRSRNLWVSSNY